MAFTEVYYWLYLILFEVGYSMFLLTDMTIDSSLGEVQITNAFDASIVDINPTFQEAVEFKEKYVHAIIFKLKEKKDHQCFYSLHSGYQSFFL